jgi:hypothetical protein
MRPKAIILALPLIAASSPLFAETGFHLPPRKPGQWEMSIQVDTAAMPPQIITMCLDGETDKLLNERFGGMASTMCTRQDQTKEGDAIILESECALGEMKSTSHTVVTGDFDAAYTMKTKVTMEGQRDSPGNFDKVAPAGPTSQETTIQAKRVGECQSGYKPGDIDLGGGKVINVRDMPAPNIQ